jgi:signal peptidase I
MKPYITKFWKNNRSLILMVILMIGFRSAIADWNTVPTGSMKPTIVEGDRIFVDKLAYDLKLPLTQVSLHHFSDPQRGDIVVFDSAAAEKRLVKRVIGLPGDTIELRSNKLIINGKATRYSRTRQVREYLMATESLGGLEHQVKFDALNQSPYSNFGPVTVPEGFYFMLGDNRDHSADSRYYGLIPRNEIVGKAEKVILSLDYDNYYIPRNERFLHDLI